MFGSLYVFLHCKGFNAIDQGERAGRKVGEVSTEAKGIRPKGAINLSHDLVRTASMRSPGTGGGKPVSDAKWHINTPVGAR